MPEFERLVEAATSRRKFIVSAAGVAGISAGGLERAMARSEPDLGRVEFVEVGVEHDHDISADDRFDYPLVENDPAVTSAVDESAGELYLGSFVPQHGVEAFRSGETVVRNRHYQAGGGTVWGGRSVGALPTELGRRHLVAEFLQVEGEYQPPEVTVTTGGGGVDVAAGGMRVSVGAGETAALALDARTVEVPVRDDEYREVADQRSGGTRQVRGVSGVETVTVEPRVQVRNYGPLDVFDAAEGDHPTAP